MFIFLIRNFGSIFLILRDSFEGDMAEEKMLAAVEAETHMDATPEHWSEPAAQ